MQKRHQNISVSDKNTQNQSSNYAKEFIAKSDFLKPIGVRSSFFFIILNTLQNSTQIKILS